jgi:hypothetical protein
MPVINFMPTAALLCMDSEIHGFISIESYDKKNERKSQEDFS